MASVHPLSAFSRSPFWASVAVLALAVGLAGLLVSVAPDPPGSPPRTLEGVCRYLGEQGLELELQKPLGFGDLPEAYLVGPGGSPPGQQCLLLTRLNTPEDVQTIVRMRPRNAVAWGPYLFESDDPGLLAGVKARLP